MSLPCTKTFFKLLVLALVFVATGCDQGPESNYDYVFEGAVTAFPDARANYVIESDDGQRFEPIELAEQFQKEGVRVRVKATDDPVPSIAMIGPTIRIEEIEEL